jgi:hypothetical protein
MNRTPTVLAALLLFWMTSSAATESSSGNPQDRVPVLVELFTSEGCSTCPPADVLLQQLDRTQPIPGANAIVLSEHVDYWNRIGWKDPFSSSFFSDRQNAYASRLGLSSVYTPQMVVDGTTELTGSEADKAREAIGKASRTPKIGMRISSIRVASANSLRVSVEVESVSDSVETRTAEIFVVLALDHTESQVLKGENAGRTLSHTGVVRKLEKIGAFRAGEKFAKDVALKIDPTVRPGNLRVIAFVQEGGMGRVLGAAEQMVGK